MKYSVFLLLLKHTIDYDFLEEVKHLHNLILVKTAVARTTYGSIVKIKIYRHLKGVWERYSEHITRVKYEWDLHILQGTLHNYQTMLQFTCMTVFTQVVPVLIVNNLL